MIDETHPAVRVMLRQHLLPDVASVAYMAQHRLGFDVEPVQVRPLSALAAAEVAWTERVRGAYREQGPGDRPTLFIPDYLLKTLAGGESDTGWFLRRLVNRLTFRAQRYLIGMMLAYHAAAYYGDAGRDAVSETAAWPGLVFPADESVRLAGHPALRRGTPADAAYRTAGPRVAVSPYDLLRFGETEIARALGLLGRERAVDLEVLRAALAEARAEGAEPGLHVLEARLAELPEETQPGTLTTLRYAVLEARRLPERAALMQDLLALAIQHHAPEATRPAARKGDLLPASVYPAEVFVLTMPGAYRVLRRRVEAILGDLEAAGAAHHTAAAERLAMLATVLRAAETERPGTLIPLEASLGTRLWNKVADQAQGEAPAAMDLGEDLELYKTGVATGRVVFHDIEGIALATRQSVEMATTTPLKAGHLRESNTWPETGRVKPYTPARPVTADEPTPAQRRIVGFFIRAAAVLPADLRAAAHRVFLRRFPQVSAETALAGGTSRVAALLADTRTPLGRAYLRWARHPDAPTARMLARSLVRVIQGQADEAAREASLRDVSRLVGAIPQLEGVAVGSWLFTAKGDPPRVSLPGILLKPGNAGALGALVDSMGPLPVTLDWDGAERRRRRHFRSSARAA